MGHDKKEQEEKEASWDNKARAESLNCTRCGSYAIYEERDIYFDTKLCGSCYHEYNKTVNDD